MELGPLREGVEGLITENKHPSGQAGSDAEPDMTAGKQKLLTCAPGQRRDAGPVCSVFVAD